MISGHTLACAMFFGSLPIEWQSVKKEKPNQESESGNQDSELVKQE